MTTATTATVDTAKNRNVMTTIDKLVVVAILLGMMTADGMMTAGEMMTAAEKRNVSMIESARGMVMAAHPEEEALLITVKAAIATTEIGMMTAIATQDQKAPVAINLEANREGIKNLMPSFAPV